MPVSQRAVCQWNSFTRLMIRCLNLACAPSHPAATFVIGFGISATDQVVQPVAEPLDAPEGVVAELAAVGFGKVREKGANAGVERHYAITAWGSRRLFFKKYPNLAGLP